LRSCPSARPFTLPALANSAAVESQCAVVEFGKGVLHAPTLVVESKERGALWFPLAVVRNYAFVILL